MKYTTSIYKILGLMTLAALISCSHAPSIQEFATTASPNEEVVKFDTDMKTAMDNQVNVLSPSNFKQAQESLSDAKHSLDKQRDAKEILHDVAEGRAYLNWSFDFAKLAHQNIEEVIVARQLAIEAEAPKVQEKEFQQADQRLMDITRDIEKNKLKKAIEKRSALQISYMELELESIKQVRLGEARDIVVQATNEGAKTFAPQSLAIAEKSIQDTDAFITANRHAKSEISTLAAETLSKSNHLLKITRDSKAGKKTSSEEIALQLESGQKAVASKQDQLTKTQVQLDNKKWQLENGEKDSQALKTSHRIFEEARLEFSKSEAEVYKQGNTLMIRLRGLEFPVAQAVIKGSNFPLLAKVQKVIKSFGKSTVTVEGHTDSNGGATLNQKLSSDRAEAVSEYLSSNNSGETLNIKSVGYGFQKPLATNKTANGRAQNRRVDILIEPDSEATSTK